MLPSRRAVLYRLTAILVISLYSACAGTTPAEPTVAPEPDDHAAEVDPGAAVEKVEDTPALAVAAAPPTAREARELIRRAVGALTHGVAVRIDQENYLGGVFDIDGNGYLDVGLLVLGQGYAELADMRVLSDSTRLYHADAHAPDLFLTVMSNIDDSLIERHRFALGRRRVVTDVSVHSLRLDRAVPAAFVVSVTTRDGSEQYWNAFARDGRPTTLLIDNTGSTRTVVSDIEGNNRLDFVRYQPVFEQGRGYDTLISWTRWTEDGFDSGGATNIVRNLARFLTGTGERLKEADWDEFVDRSVLPATVHELRQAGLSSRHIVDALFLPESDTSFSGLADQVRIEQVIFPDIARNPFPAVGIQTSFRTLFRVMTADSGSHFFHAEIGMQQNPFQPQQFFFRPTALQGE